MTGIEQMSDRLSDRDVKLFFFLRQIDIMNALQGPVVPECIEKTCSETNKISINS